MKVDVNNKVLDAVPTIVSLRRVIVLVDECTLVGDFDSLMFHEKLPVALFSVPVWLIDRVADVCALAVSDDDSFALLLEKDFTDEAEKKMDAVLVSCTLLD